MQTGMAAHDTDQEQGNPMNSNPNRGSSRKEKQMNAITKATSVAVLVTLGLALAARAAEPPAPAPLDQEPTLPFTIRIAESVEMPDLNPLYYSDYPSGPTAIEGDLRSIGMNGDGPAVRRMMGENFESLQARPSGAAGDSGARPAVRWQYVLDMPTSRGPQRAAMWLPPGSKQIRGLLLDGGGEIMTDPAIRKACAEGDIGILRLVGVGGLFHYWEPGEGSAAQLLRHLEVFAKRSGHPELARVPWITFGHSTGGIFCRNVAYWKPDRVAAVIHYKSGNFHQKDHLPPSGSLAGVPVLVINGQYETYGPDGVEQPDEKDKRLDKRYGRETQWVYVRSDIQKFRRRDPNHLMSLLLDLGGDHFFGSPELWEHAALFIRKTARYRLPAKLPSGDGPVPCLPLKAEDGWLTDPNLKAPTHKPAPCKDYTGDKAAAFWHYDREMADAIVAHHRNLASPQCLTNPVAAWLDDDDGWTFRVRSEWLDALPETYCGPLAGMKVGHSETPLVYRRLPTEPVEQTGPDSFRLLRPARTVHIAAVHPGDDKYRATNRWGNVTVPTVKGEKQTIEFSPIGDLKPSTAGIALKATASAGLPVYFEVDYGPVVIEDGLVIVRDLPTNPQYPFECRLTAWQVGRRGASPVGAAPPVSQTFHVVAP